MRKVELGTWAEIPSPYATNIMAKAGFDFSILDNIVDIMRFHDLAHLHLYKDE